MDFSRPNRVEALRAQLQDFLYDHILPANRDWLAIARQGRFPSEIVEPLKEEARVRGLWNLDGNQDDRDRPQVAAA